MSFVWSALALLGLWVGMFTVTRVVYERIAGRRGLDVVRPSGAGREMLARLAGGFAPALIPILLYSVSLIIGGRSANTCRISPLEDSAALRGGLRKGDRVLAVDGQPTATWDLVRGALRAGHARDEQNHAPTARQIRIERAGQELTLAVTADAQGRIGVSPITTLEPVPPLEALTESLHYQLIAVVEIFKISPGEHPDFQGPVGIIRETAHSAISNFLLMVAGLGTWLTPACIAGHLFDAATLPWFLAANPEATTADVEVRRRFRVARLRQLLLLLAALGGSGLLLYSAHIVPPLALACVAWLGPLLTPVSWLLAREVRGSSAALLTLVGLGVPFLNLYVIWRLSTEARLYLTNHGVPVRWFRSKRV